MSAVTQPRMNDREVVRCECAFLLDRKERYRKAAGLPPSTNHGLTSYVLANSGLTGAGD